MDISNTDLAEKTEIAALCNNISPLKNILIVHRECRICLEQQSSNNNDILIAPCNCSGSIKFVHFRCMKIWIEKNYMMPLYQAEKISQFLCQMCKKNIQFQSYYQITCKNWSQLVSAAQKQTCNFLFLSILCLISLALGFLGISFLVIWSKNMSFMQSPSLITIICVIIALIFFSIILFICIKQYAIIIQSKIIRIGSSKQNKLDKRQVQIMTTQQLALNNNQNRYFSDSRKIHPVNDQRQNYIFS